MVATGEQSWLGRLFLAIFAAVFLSSGLSAFATTWHSDGTETNVQALLATASDGDTITLPAGTFSWTTGVNITKGITLQGQTTITGAGTATPIINDNTVIINDIPGASFKGIVGLHVPPGKSVRMTGLTFEKGPGSTPSNFIGAFPLSYSGSAASESYRVDHCHFKPLNMRTLWINGWIHGVADHNVFDFSAGSPAVFAQANTWGGSGKQFGNGSYEDYPWFGTSKFFFVEDNSFFQIGGTSVRSAHDGDQGGRIVWRYNYMKDCNIGNHGTEGGVRGGRAYEVYNNIFDRTFSGAASSFRSGVSLFHDNTWTGTAPGNIGVDNFRQTSTRPYPIWGISDGTSPWDMNDTEGNGTYVEGHPPYLFANGSATSGSTIFREQATFSDSTKNWTPNQWVGYSIKNTNPASASYTLGSYIISNDAHSISYAYNRATNGGHLLFNPGDTYEIHRVLVMMDQNGRGKGDQITGPRQPINRGKGNQITGPRQPINRGKGDQTTAPRQPINRGKGDQTTAPRQPINRGKGNQITAPRQPINRGKGGPIMGARKPPINARNGTSSWPQQALEPCYSWNNIYTPNGHAMGYGVRRGQPTTKLNVDFFNLGAGFPADSTPSQVSSRYTAALNGVDYVGTFVYPHPLVSGNQRSPSATGGPSNNSQKNEKPKREKTAKKISERDN